MRDIVFVSHANPEDNEFARWLALRLAADGFPVWCDVTQFLGGEDFWRDAEAAIRGRTVKFLYVLSKTSNHKPGPLKELAVAQKVQKAEPTLTDFVIPLAIDGLLPANYNIELTRLIAIPFNEGWHAGLIQLFKKLEREGISRSPAFGPEAVASWWRERANTEHTILKKPEKITTNLYQLRPADLQVHRVGLDLQNAPIEELSIPYPFERFGEYLISFAPASDLAGRLGTGMRIVATDTYRVGDPSVHRRHSWSYRDERATLTKLLNRAWQNMLIARGLPTYQFSTGAPALYFKTGILEKNTIPFRRPDGSASSRQMIGYRTIGRGTDKQWIRHWHFAVGARPTTSPAWGFVMKPHVLFSNDGLTIWDSVDRLQRARRSQCKNWWNNDWRDLNYAAVQFLAQGAQIIALPVGGDLELELSAQPVEYLSRVSYDERSLKQYKSKMPGPGSVEIGEDSEDDEDDEEA